VIGAGGVGGYCVQVARAFGAQVVAIDVDPRKLAAIAADGGAALTLNAREHDAKALKARSGLRASSRPARHRVEDLRMLGHRRRADQTAFGLLVHGATLSVVGFTMDKVEVRLSNLMAFDARALGNWGCPPELYPAALDLVLDGKVQLALRRDAPAGRHQRVFDAVHRREITRRAVMVPA
jgi:6-hydroxycyclohex-1-ene-1-carbonyl-CoA dehydrogenase